MKGAWLDNVIAADEQSDCGLLADVGELCITARNRSAKTIEALIMQPHAWKEYTVQGRQSNAYAKVGSQKAVF